VLYGIVLGFVVYVVTEMAGRAGEAGVVQPVIAVLGPALIAIVAGATVLLNREDGRT
jgi:lipopolysaccharide export system permease protein